MKIRELVNQNEKIIQPFTSIASIENDLINNFYLVIKDGLKFIGLLTPSDVVASGHNLVVDCYSEKQPVNENEEAENVMNIMLKKGLLVAPVFDNCNNYLGSVQINTMLQKVWDITKQNVSINWINVVDSRDTDNIKQEFSSELFHNTRNPVQVILSAVDMIRSDPDNFERKMLLCSIESNARLLDTLITKLYMFYFEKRGNI